MPGLAALVARWRGKRRGWGDVPQAQTMEGVRAERALASSVLSLVHLLREDGAPPCSESVARDAHVSRATFAVIRRKHADRICDECEALVDRGLS